MKLNFKVVGEEGVPVIILHGLFGSLDNWISIAKVLADRNFKVYLVDQRNHGKSPHMDSHSYDDMAEDLKEFLEDQQLSSAILLGHSMGGKTIMNFSLNYPMMVEKLIVVDISPKHYPPHHEQILRGLHSVNVNTVTNRKQADERMSAVIDNVGVRQFLLKNMDRLNSDSFTWKMNLPVLEQNIHNIGEPLKAGTFEGKVYFIAGGASDYILRGDRALIISHFPQAKIATIKGAGHWIHAEKTDQFLDVLLMMLHG